MRKENGPIYLMIFLMFFGFCNFVRLPFDKEILIAIINGLFLLVAAIYGTNTLAKKTQMRKYSEMYVKQEQALFEELYAARNMAEVWHKEIEKYGLNSEQADIAMDKAIEEEQIYNKKVADYKILLTEIYLYCGNEIPCEFDFIATIDVIETGKVIMSKQEKENWES